MPGYWGVWGDGLIVDLVKCIQTKVNSYSLLLLNCILNEFGTVIKCDSIYYVVPHSSGLVDTTSAWNEGLNSGRKRLRN